MDDSQLPSPADDDEQNARNSQSGPPGDKPDDSNADGAFLREFQRSYERRKELPQVSPSVSFFDRLKGLARIGLGRAREESVDKSQLETPEPVPLQDSIEWLVQSGPPYSRFGRFNLVKLLGTGTSAYVFLAVERESSGVVALKVGRSKVMSYPPARARFERESQLAQKLDHPHIVKVLECGVAEKHCYMTMEYCDGVNLATWLAQHPGDLTYDQIALIVLRLAQAVEHAQTFGIVHRDIKPENVLLNFTQPTEGLPFCPKLADFGIATEFGEGTFSGSTASLKGTPEFMAPEQISQRSRDLTTATDVYGLGALFYYLLTGEPPTGKADIRSTLLRSLLGDVPAVREKNPQVPKLLGEICDSCLRHRPSLRCASASVLVEDLSRYLERQKPKWRMSRMGARVLRKFASRQVSLIAPLLLVVVAVVAGLGWWRTSSEVRRLQEDLQQAREEIRIAPKLAQESQAKFEAFELAARKRAYEQDFVLIRHDLAAQQYLPAERRLVAQSDFAKSFQLGGLEWPLAARRLQAPHFNELVSSKSPQHFVTVDPTGKYFAIGGADDAIRVYSATNYELLWETKCGQIEVNGAAFAKNSHRIATVGDDGTVRLWDWREGKLSARFELFKLEQCHHVVFVENDSLLACAGKRSNLKLIDAQTGAQRAELPHVGEVMSLITRDTGRQVLVAGSGPIQLWDVASKSLVRSFAGHTDRVAAIALTQNGRRLVSVGRDSMIAVWDVETGAIQAKLTTSKRPHSLALNSNDEAFVVGTEDGSLLSYRLRPSSESAIETIVELPPRMKVHRDQVDGLGFAADGQSLITASRDCTAGVFEAFLYDNPWNAATTPSSEPIGQLRASRTSDVVCLQRDHNVELWNSRTQKLERRLDLPAKLATNQQLVAGDVSEANYVAVTDRGTVLSWNMDDGRVVGEWSLPVAANAKLTVNAQLMVLNMADERAALVDAKTGQTRQSWNRTDCRNIFWSANGKQFAKLDAQTIQVHEWPSCDLVRTIRCDGAGVSAVQFSPNGAELAVASDRLRLYRLKDNVPPTESDVDTFGLRELWYSPTGDRLLSSDKSAILRVWHAQTANLLLEHPTRVKCEQFVPTSSGRFLVYVDREANKLRRIGPLQ